jgi:putative two-component system response regulator
VAPAERRPVKDASVLIVDDEAANVLLLERLLEVSDFTNVASTTHSSEVVALCTSFDPDLIVLDLHMPDPDGFEVMGMLSPWIQGPTKLPVLVATADVNPETKRRALAAGARDFLTKPLDPSEVVVRIENLLEARLLQLELREQAKALEKAVEAQSQELTDAALEVIEPLAVASAFRDDDQDGHALRVARTSGLLARELGIPEESAELIGRAARLHDVGKIGLPDDLLLHPGRLAAEDRELMKSHVAIGAEILGHGRSRLLKLAAEIARTHHERWDGSGYPEGLRGEHIPVPGRIVGLADTFDGLVHNASKLLPEAVAEIQRRAGREFDPNVLRAFEALDHEGLVAPARRVMSAV